MKSDDKRPNHTAGSNAPYDSVHNLERVFNVQKSAYEIDRYPSFTKRKERLHKLSKLIKDNQQEIISAVNLDFGNRAEVETRLVEIVSSLASIEYMSSNLKKWMKQKRRSTSLWFLPGSNIIKPQPIGVIGIMSPWNYPINLAVVPIAAAFAAGNCAMVRMSEYTPRTTTLFQSLIRDSFEEGEVSIFGGDAQFAARFADMPYNHLLFTGSTSVGRKIMAAAAKNLTPVTLELGGKSPVIIDKDYSIAEAAERVTWGKTFNAGQTCVAPDYVFVPRDKVDKFIEHSFDYFDKRYAEKDHKAYTSIVNDQMFSKMTALIEDARNKGAKVTENNGSNLSLNINNRILPLTIIETDNLDTVIMQEEIFGPVMLVRPYDELDETIEIINQGERPLGLYLFSNNSKNQHKVMEQTISGGVAINDVMLQFLQVDLPFGGVGASGFGKYHGKEGFETFSNMKPIFRQRGVGSFTGLKTLYPPYGKVSSFMIRAMGGGIKK